MEKIITTKFLQVKKKVTEKKVRMREGEEKGTEKVKKGYYRKEGTRRREKSKRGSWKK